MVILLLAILAAVAIPNFQDFRTEARNAATQGALGGLRAAIAVARAAIALKEEQGVPVYPTFLEMSGNAYNGSHPVLNALSSTNKKIMDGANGVPVNPWSMNTIPLAQQNSMWDCASLTKSTVRSTADQSDFGWCYRESTGEIWANSDRNASTPPENQY